MMTMNKKNFYIDDDFDTTLMTDILNFTVLNR